MINTNNRKQANDHLTTAVREADGNWLQFHLAAAQVYATLNLADAVRELTDMAEDLWKRSKP